MTCERDAGDKNVGQQCWFHFHGDERSAENRIRADLATVGVTLVELGSPAAGCGILCFSRIDNELFSLLASLRRETRGSIIALAAPSIVPDPCVTRRLLAAGSSEVLICDGREDVAFQIQARLERWRTIDGLAEYAASRASLAGQSPAWNTLIKQIADVGRFTNAPILLIGESGTGKELLARLVAMVDARAGDVRAVNAPESAPEARGVRLQHRHAGALRKRAVWT